MDTLLDKQIKIDMVNKDNTYAVDSMINALHWLSENRDEDQYGDQESVTPLLIIYGLSGIEDVLVGANPIIDWLEELK